jgi:mannose-6-phosphate isomerase-like protein (cupin superfamily)
MSVRRLSPVVVAVAVLAAGCATTATKQASPAAQGFDSTTLAEGVFANVRYADPGNPDYTPTTPVFASVVDFPQAPGETAPAAGHAHPSGFVYGLAGTAQVNLDDGTTIPVGPGRAVFAPPFVHHTHSNPGSEPNDWLFLGIRTESARTKPLPSPQARIIIDTADLPPLVVGGNYAMRLDRFMIRPGGQSPAVRQGGPTLLFVLKGSDSLHQMNEATKTVEVNQAGFLPEGSVYQLRNPSTSDESQVLVMTMWLQGNPANSTVDTALP